MFIRYTYQFTRTKSPFKPLRSCSDKPPSREYLKSLLRRSKNRTSSTYALPILKLIPWEREKVAVSYDLEQMKSSLISFDRCAPMYDIAIRLVKERIALDVTESRSDSRELEKIVHISPQSLQLLDIVVIAGEYDIVERVLAWAEIPFALLRPSEAITFPFTPSQTIIVNCTQHIFPENFHDKIRNFVKDGGQLITSDRALTSILQEAFPGIMESKGSKLNRTWTRPNYVYVKVPKHVNDDRLLSTLAGEPDKQLTWCVDFRSDVVSIKDLNKVNILLSSQTLKMSLGQEGVLFHFNFGQGEVFHSVPHFLVHKFQEEPNFTQDKTSNEILEYIKLKKGSQKLVELTTTHLSEYGPNYFSYSGLRNIATSLEFLLRVILRQKQKQTGPVILVPKTET